MRAAPRAPCARGGGRPTSATASAAGETSAARTPYFRAPRRAQNRAHEHEHPRRVQKWTAEKEGSWLYLSLAAPRKDDRVRRRAADMARTWRGHGGHGPASRRNFIDTWGVVVSRRRLRAAILGP